MGKPAKIRKKKSFMFTTKHHSFTGILGLVIAIISVIVTALLIMDAYRGGGKTDSKAGVMGLALALMNIIGIISGAIGVRERDVHITPPIIAMIANGIMLIVWIVMLFLANR